MQSDVKVSIKDSWWWFRFDYIVSTNYLKVSITVYCFVCDYMILYNDHRRDCPNEVHTFKFTCINCYFGLYYMFVKIYYILFHVKNKFWLFV